jgi:hypothetical protein
MESELREERELIKEHAYLRKLEECIADRNEGVCVRVLARIRRYERRLERAHRHVMFLHEELRNEGFPPEAIERFERIESDIEYFIEDFNAMTMGNEPELLEMIEKEAWEELERFVIGNLERDIDRWLDIDRALTDLELDLLLDSMER